MTKLKDILKKYPLLVVFTAFMLAVFVADMYATGRQFSELENRKLKQRPVFSVASLVANEYTRKYEEFINDQFVERDAWISLKSVAESVLCKIENNGVAYGGESFLFGKKTTTDQPQIDKNLGYLNQFVAGYTGHVTLGVIPNSYEMLPELLPAGMQYIQVKQQPSIDAIYAGAVGENLTKLDVSAAVSAVTAPANRAYYRTDHHWRTNTAYAVYADYCAQRGLKAVPMATLDPLRHDEQGFYGTYYSKAKRTGSVADTLTWYDIPVTDITVNGEKFVTDADDNKIPLTGLYQKEKFLTRDKYAAFLYGNNGLTVIKSDNNLNKTPGKTSRLLLVKDSYSNCLVPFLTYSYDELYVVDLRGLGQKFSELTQSVAFDDLWVLYNWESFEGDRNFTRLTF